MSRDTNGEEMVRTHLWIYKRDYERLMAYFGESIGLSRAARMMIRKFLDNLEAQSDATANPIRSDDDSGKSSS